MSYSRWICSDWYVFWHTSEAKRKEDELLALWHVSDERLPVFSYRDLRDINTAEDLRRLLGLNIPVEDYEECLRYVKEWRQDVEKEYASSETGA